MKDGKYLINEVRRSEKVYQDFRLEVEERRRPQLAAGARTTRSTISRTGSRGSRRFDFPRRT